MSAAEPGPEARTASEEPAPARRVLVVGVGNVLRGDDMFGIELARRLGELDLPAEVELTETGIAGIALVQALMPGYDGLLILDAVARGKPPGTLVLLEPRVTDPQEMTPEQRCDFFADLHQTDPSRALMMARALGCLPPRVRILGCEVGDCDELLTDMTPRVQAALPAALDLALQTLGEWLGADLRPLEVPA